MHPSTCTPRLERCLIACVAALCLVTCGCVDLDEITQFAKVSQDVRKAIPVLPMRPKPLVSAQTAL